MAVTIFVVRATITKDKEADFNRWYNEEHAPQVLQYNGAVSARRYKKILGDDRFEYLAVYEFASEEIFHRFAKSEHLQTLVKEYDANFGGASERARAAYVQIWPEVGARSPRVLGRVFMAAPAGRTASAGCGCALPRSKSCSSAPGRV
jgi:antibiotic biosynthesis monooxygenase (ABM) superfamily enzyme